MSPQAGRPPRITDVAREAGVAISSASAALNHKPGVSDATRARVLAVAEELGYVPSLRGRSLSSKRAFTVGLVMEREPDVMSDDPFFGSFIGGIEESLAPRGYALAVRVGQDIAASEARYVELASNRRVDGVFLTDLRVDDPRIAPVYERGLPAVGVNPAPDGFPFPSVRQDGTEALTELLQWLVRLGHTRIAHVSGPLEYLHSVDRRSCFCATLADLGLDPSVCVEADFTYAGGYRAAEQLLALSPRPTAVFCANDLMAVGVMNRALDCGLRIPEDLSVAGYDGVALGTYTRPPLTTIQTSPRLLGRAAASLLLDAVDGRVTPSVRVEVPRAHVVARGTVGAAPR